MRKYLLFAAIVGLLIPYLNAAADGNVTQTTNVTVTIGPEAALQASTSTTSLTSSGSIFNDYTGTTSLVYKIRTSKAGGGGNIQLQVTSDFSPNGGPSVASPPTAGDTLNYTCSAASPATACSGTQTAKTSAATPVATFGSNARSTKTGNNAAVSWTLTNDPAYETGSYTAVVTFTVSNT